MITSSGLRCDVCGQYILPIVNEEYSAFRCNGIDTELHCHDRECRPVLERSLAAKDWSMLPAGPLRKVFEDAAAEKAEEPSHSPQHAQPAKCPRCGAVLTTWRGVPSKACVVCDWSVEAVTQQAGAQ